MNIKRKGALSSLHNVKRNFLPLPGIKRLYLDSLTVANNFELAFNESSTFFESVIGLKHFETKNNKYYVTRDNFILLSLRRLSYFQFQHISREQFKCLNLNVSILTMVLTNQSGSWSVCIQVCDSLIRHAVGLLNEGVEIPKDRIYIRQNKYRKKAAVKHKPTGIRTHDCRFQEA